MNTDNPPLQRTYISGMDISESSIDTSMNVSALHGEIDPQNASAIHIEDNHDEDSRADVMLLDDLKKNLEEDRTQIFQAPIPYSTPVSASNSPFMKPPRHPNKNAVIGRASAFCTNQQSGGASPFKVPNSPFKAPLRKTQASKSIEKQPQISWSLDDFVLIEQLDKGKFGIVYLAREKRTGVQVAIKAVKKDHILRQNMHTQLRNEVEIHTRLMHSNVIRMYGYFHDQTRVYMIMEYSRYGSLFKQLGQRKSFTEAEAASVIHQLCDAAKYLHSRHVIHRDIKPENVLITSQNPMTVKLCDFGWAAHAVDQRRQTFCGTVDYVAPEIARKDVYGPQIDIWCIGILLYQLLTGRPPFLTTTDKETFDKIKRQEYVLPSYLSLEAISLIKSVLVEGSTRLSLDQIMEHQFMMKNFNRRRSLPHDFNQRVAEIQIKSGENSSAGSSLGRASNEEEDVSYQGDED